MNNIITRFAPAPTGKLHIGSVRTTLFNYLFAKKYNGKFIIRIDDTNIQRSKPEFEKDILDGLKWLGISYDKNFDKNFFRQSERFNIYEKYVEKLLENNLAYKCFCSKEETEIEKEEQKRRGIAPIYSGKCSKLKDKKHAQKNFVIRLRVNSFNSYNNYDSCDSYCDYNKREIVFTDLIHGEIRIKIDLIGDFIIAKIKDNKIVHFLYNFASVVDDYEMKISHIFRGEEHISNTPKQVLIQKALNFPIPKYAHVPLILGIDRSKMSKRSGAVSITSYKEDGYLPEALINFLAFLCWSPKDEREFFTMEELIKEFSIEKIRKSAAIFNIEKLDYINGYYIRKKSISELTELCLPYLIQSGLITLVSGQKYKNLDSSGNKNLDSFGNKNLDSSGNKNLISYGIGKNPEFFRFAQKYQKKNGEIVDLEYIKKVISIYQERLKKLSEISELTDYFFIDKLEYKKEMFIWKDMNYEEILKSLKFTKKIICDRMKNRNKNEYDDNNFNQNKLKEIIMEAVPIFNKSINLPLEFAQNKGFILWPFRVALTAKKASSGPFEIAEILGKKEIIKRIDQAVSFLEKE